MLPKHVRYQLRYTPVHTCVRSQATNISLTHIQNFVNGFFYFFLFGLQTRKGTPP